jgi:zinc transport system ATP-binding protein
MTERDQTETESVLSIRDLSVRAGGRTVLRELDLDVRRGEVVALTGPNGAGKTSLLRAIAGELPWEGTLERTGRLGYVPQNLQFDPSSCATVLDLFAACLSSRPIWLGIGGRMRRQAKESLCRTGAAHLLHARFGRLSGGERQRVLLALSLTPVPDLLLLDEPEAGIDVVGLRLFHHVVGSVCLHCRIGVLLATHASESVQQIAHGEIRLEDGRPVPAFLDDERRT